MLLFFLVECRKLYFGLGALLLNKYKQTLSSIFTVYSEWENVIQLRKKFHYQLKIKLENVRLLMEGIRLLKQNVQKTFDNIFVAGAFIFLITHLQSQKNSHFVISLFRS